MGAQSVGLVSLVRANPNAIGCMWTGEFDLNRLRVDREIFQSGKNSSELKNILMCC